MVPKLSDMKKSVKAVENINSHAETGRKYAANRAYRRGLA
jgi:hypothetical protein